MSRVRNGLIEAARLLTDAAGRYAPDVERLGADVASRLEAGARVLCCGNGGSAADAEHVACELAGRFRLERTPLDVLAITSNSSLMTALANDYGYEAVFARQVDAHGRSGDVLLLFTTSGRSRNVVAARDAAVQRGLLTVAFTGAEGDSFAAGCDVAFVVPSTDTPRIQEVHIALAHALCEDIEARLFGS